MCCASIFYFFPSLNPLFSAIKGYLQKDKYSYGGAGAHAAVTPEELNPWQQGVDDSLAEAAAAADDDLTDTEN